MNNEGRMSFLTHIEELRTRILYSGIAIALIFMPAYLFSARIFDFLMSPIRNNLPPDSYIIFTNPAEGFVTYLKVSLFASFVASFPFIMYQFWNFISPALYKNEKKIVIPFIIFGTLFFIIGAAFCYYVAAPSGLKFLLGEYSSSYVKAFPSMRETLSFLMSLMIGFGVVFEFPLIIFVLARLGLVGGKWLRDKRKYAMLLSSVVAAAITPTTDALSMMFMLVPLFVFYEIGIIVAAVFGREKRDKKAKNETEDTDFRI